MENAFAQCENPGEMKESWMKKWLPIDSDRRKRAAAYGYPVLEAGRTTDWLQYEQSIQSALALQTY